jgi:multidrug efflux pump subunit AcrA (membrane-fusion protein)
MARWLCCVLCLASVCCWTASAVPEDQKPKQAAPAKDEKKPAEAKKDSPAKVATHKVEKGPFRVEVSLKGIFESPNMTEVSLRPEAWTPDNRGMMIVVRAVDHGAHVKKGDTLVWLDLEKIDQAIRDLEAERHLAELAIKQAEEELPVLEKSTPLELSWLERAKMLSDEDIKWFDSLDRPLAEKMAQFMVKYWQHHLDYAKEELRQLEKMYRANDIREETEEIILKRQRNAVEQAIFLLQESESERDRTMKVELPRREQQLQENAIRRVIALDKGKATLPLQMNQRRLALEKMKYDHNKSEDRLRKLQRDRASMTVKAPADGIVYYGQWLRGQWSSAGMAQKLHAGGTLMPEEVFMTVVEPRPLFVRAAVEEKDWRDVKPGQAAKAVIVGDPDSKLPARIDQVSAIPVTPGNFEARLSLDPAHDISAIMPGMTCTVQLTPYVKKDALTVPSKAVFRNELDPEKHYVYLEPKEGKPEKHDVQVGRASGDSTEIRSGLKEGDLVLLEKPKADAAAK